METSQVGVEVDESGNSFSYVRGHLIVRDDPAVWTIVGVDPDDEDRVVGRRTVGRESLALVRGLEPGAELELAAQHPEVLEPDHVMYAHHAPHPSQVPHAGAVSPLTADWVVSLPTGPLGAAAPSYSGMRASPLHMNPLHMNPLHMNPLHMNPLLSNPLHMNPLHMNGLASSAIPTTHDRRRGETSGDIGAPPDHPFTGSPTVAIYVIDTGLGQQSGPNKYASQVLGNYGAIDGTYADAPDRWEPLGLARFFVDPVAGHGTFIAGIYGQLLHAAGQRPSITVFQNMNERGLVEEWEVVDRIAEILLTRPDLPGVLNLSFGGTMADFSLGGLNALRLAVDAASHVLIVVASAGNVSVDEPHYPAAFDEVIGVGALDANGVAWFSNFGDWVECWAAGVDLISPFLQLNPNWKSALFLHSGIKMQGVILGTNFAGFNDPNSGDDYGSDWVAWSGTSFAAPVVGSRVAELLADDVALEEARAQAIAEFPLRSTSPPSAPTDDP